MGFSLEEFFKELYRVMASEGKASKKLKRLERAIYEGEKYAIECGLLPRPRRIKK